VSTQQEFVNYREAGAVKTAFDFSVQDAGVGWSEISTETRVAALGDATCRGMGRYWRLIVPGSGLLRLQWLEGIKRRARHSRRRGLPGSQVDHVARGRSRLPSSSRHTALQCRAFALERE